MELLCHLTYRSSAILVLAFSFLVCPASLLGLIWELGVRVLVVVGGERGDEKLLQVEQLV